MLDIQRASLPLSSLLQFPTYSSLIHSSILPNLTKLSSITRWVAIAAHFEKELVGLALCEIYPLNRLAQFHSLVVKPSYRRQGIGRRLFAFTEDLLIQEEKVEAIELLYEQVDPFTPILEKIMTSLGWSPAKMFLIRCHFDAEAFNPSWLQHAYPLPSSMHLFSWKDLKVSERGLIQHEAQQGRFLPYLSPFRDETSVDKDTSFGLRQNGKVVGWCITRRPNPETIRYSSLYIDSSLLHAGYGIQLLVESIKRQKKLHIPRALFEINLREIDASWWQFVKKRLMPIADQVERIKRAFRVFTIYLD